MFKSWLKKSLFSSCTLSVTSLQSRFNTCLQTCTKGVFWCLCVVVSFSVPLVVICFLFMLTFSRSLLRLVLLGSLGFSLSPLFRTLNPSWPTPSKRLALLESSWLLGNGYWTLCRARSFATSKRDTRLMRTHSRFVFDVLDAYCEICFFFPPFRRTRRKKKVKKPGVPAASSQATFSDADTSGSTRSRRRGRSTDRPLPKRPTGHSNGAFVPETWTHR